jgi:hypothetical protein
MGAFRAGVSRIGYAACGVLVLGLWLPWATLSIGLFGDAPERLGTVDGQEIGSGLLDLPVGWVAAGAGALGIYALARRRRGPAIAADVIGLLVSAYALLAIPGEETSTSNGEDVSYLVNGQVGYAWGVWAVAASAVALFIVGTRLSPQAAVISEQPVDQPFGYDAG